MSASKPGKSRRPAGDPLVLLREHTMDKKKVHWSEDYLEFESGRIHRSAKCGFRLQGKLVDIGSVWYMLRETSCDRSYTQDIAKKRGFTYIGVASRSDLCDYILGVSETCVGIVPDVIEGRKRPRADEALQYAEPPSAKAAKAQAVEEISYADVQERVRPVKDLDVLVRCPGKTVPNADLILKIAQDEWKHWHTAGKAPEVQPLGKTPLINELEEGLRKNRDNKPIILVPCNKHAPVNMLNVHGLLQDGVYSRPVDERLKFFESTRPEFVEVSRNVGGKMWTFEVRDSAKNFTKAQWLRTVMVVTDGSDWQFKGWPFETVVDLFTTVKGIYFQAAGHEVPLHVINWPVTVVKMSAIHLEHRFSHVRDAFFDSLSAFLNAFRMKRFVNHATLEGGKRVIIKPKPIL